MRLAKILAAIVVAAVLPLATAAAPQKVLRYAFEVAETSLDPAKIIDLYSRILTPHIFEGLYHYDHLARPIKMKPLTADGMQALKSGANVIAIHCKQTGGGQYIDAGLVEVVEKK